MCGNATLAMEVSSTSIKVASVTVTAITQGLIEPSGIRSFEMSLFFTRLNLPPALKGLCCTSFYSVTTVASTFMPGRRMALSCGIGSSTIFTGTRCTTFT